MASRHCQACGNETPWGLENEPHTTSTNLPFNPYKDTVIAAEISSPAPAVPKTAPSVPALQLPSSLSRKSPRGHTSRVGGFGAAAGSVRAAWDFDLACCAGCDRLAARRAWSVADTLGTGVPDHGAGSCGAGPGNRVDQAGKPFQPVGWRVFRRDGPQGRAWRTAPGTQPMGAARGPLWQARSAQDQLSRLSPAVQTNQTEGKT